MSTTHALAPGASLMGGKYTIERVLGSGTFGITYLARGRFVTHGNLGRMTLEAKVAVKEFFMNNVNSRSGDGSSVDGSASDLFTNYRNRFRKEAESLSHLSHDNIVKVLDVFDENGTSYYVMDFIDGENLNQYIDSRGCLSETESIYITAKIGEALSYMHSKNMLHLDIKPNNVMRTGQADIVVIDFGLAKQFNSGGNPETSTTIGLGTPGYAPIEQAQYKRDGAFPATLDVYALGATLFKMLTGNRPPEATVLLNDGFPDDEIHAYVSEHTRTVLHKAMAPIKRNRYQSIDDFITALTDLESTLIAPATPKSEETKVDTSKPAPKADTAKPQPKAYSAKPGPKADTAKSQPKAYSKPGPKADTAKPQPKAYSKPGPKVDTAQLVLEYETKGKELYKAKRYAESLEIFRKGADLGSPECMFYIAEQYRCGRAVGLDDVQAVEWYRKAAYQGHAAGQNGLGYMYENGYGVDQNYAKAFEWYRKAAEQGLAQAQFNLGVMYGHGFGVDQDVAKERELYLKAADQGNADAEYALGELNEWKENYSEAIKWYSLATEHGSRRAPEKIAEIYYGNRGDNTRYCPEAVKWYRICAEQHSRIWADIDCRYLLGTIYEEGLGVAKDIAEAVKWYKRSTETKAESKLGILYKEGRGVEKNYRKAEYFLESAADLGDEEAQFNLGEMYELGLGVEQDDLQAAKLYKESAEEGHTLAKERLKLVLAKKSFFWRIRHGFLW